MKKNQCVDIFHLETIFGMIVRVSMAPVTIPMARSNPSPENNFKGANISDEKPAARAVVLESIAGVTSCLAL